MFVRKHNDLMMKGKCHMDSTPSEWNGNTRTVHMLLVAVLDEASQNYDVQSLLAETD
jgi:hypothetical protein